MKAWYAFYTKPNCEERAIEALAKRGLAAYALRGSGARKALGELLFPRYLFVYGDLVTADMATETYLPGLGELISFAGKPAIVPSQTIVWMQAWVQGIDSEAFSGDAGAAQCALVAEVRAALQGAGSSAERTEILLRFLRQVNGRDVSQVVPPTVAAAEVHHRRRRTTRGHGRKIHYKD